MAVKTVFGWTVQGQVGTRKSTGVCSSAAGVMRIGVSEQIDKETSALRECELWWGGPPWLQEDDTHWLTISEPSSKVAECQMEERKVTVMPIVSSPSMAILNVENYSSSSRVMRVTAWVRRFVDNCHKKEEKTIAPLLAEEVIGAERYWLAKAQGDAFSDISNLRNRRQLHKSSSVMPFNPYFDNEGLMRVDGRLQFSDNNEETKHPIVLPGNHPLTSLLIRKEHLRMLHTGVRDTLGP
ncbi:hypothetical protein HPB49_007633 [Dermacentor silvarum]|uniref:Uncharacterized protein n=1 Tax=Dermacentor silvarum TaxID=543639 RepID=A0ACB8CW19_DERSI|nr:hypothetical protein HPB49_007633 [Dermacentor silvarum]